MQALPLRSPVSFSASNTIDFINRHTSQGTSSYGPRRLWFHFPGSANPTAPSHDYTSRISTHPRHPRIRSQRRCRRSVEPYHLLFLSDIWYLLGSPAARYQSLCYGGNTPASSLFAILQSIGMKYHTVTLSNWVLATIRLLAGLLFVYVALGMTLWW
jgi:hypothetical protein